MLHLYFLTVFSTDQSLIVDPATLFSFTFHWVWDLFQIPVIQYSPWLTPPSMTWQKCGVYGYIQYDKVQNTTFFPNNNNAAKIELTNNLQIAEIHIGFIDDCRCITAIVSNIRQRNIFHWDLITTSNLLQVSYSFCAARYVFPWNICGIACNDCRITLIHKLNTRPANSWA